MTLDLQLRVTQECVYTTGLYPACTDADYYLPLIVSYDSNDFTLLDVGFGWQLRVMPLQVTVPWQGLGNVWNGDLFHASYATALYSNNGPPRVEYRELDSGVFDAAAVDVCDVGSNCLWQTYFTWGDRYVPTPPFLSPPTLGDLERDLQQGHFRYFTAAYYLDANDKVQYLPGSRSFSGNIPEPSGMALLGIGLGLAGLRSRRNRTGRVAAARFFLPVFFRKPEAGSRKPS